ncbi:MAG: alpha/beta hydrolase [Myxococcota bacterium]
MLRKTALTAALAALATLVAADAMALNPSRTYKQRPDKFNMAFTEAKVPTNDGTATLNVWTFPAKTKTTKLVLISHNGEGNMGDYLRRVDALTGQFNVVAFDYRGFGESSEFEIDNNMFIYPHFQDDYATMLDYCRKTHGKSFAVYGWGIGAGLALGIGYGRPELTRIIADTPFLSMEDLERRFSSWDTPMEVPFAGYEKRYEPQTALDGAPGKQLTGITLIVGSKDQLFSLKDMKALQAKQKKLVDKAIYVVENPDRKDNFAVDRDAYAKRLLAALDGK